MWGFQWRFLEYTFLKVSSKLLIWYQLSEIGLIYYLWWCCCWISSCLSQFMTFFLFIIVLYQDQAAPLCHGKYEERGSPCLGDNVCSQTGQEWSGKHRGVKLVAQCPTRSTEERQSCDYNPCPGTRSSTLPIGLCLIFLSMESIWETKQKSEPLVAIDPFSALNRKSWGDTPLGLPSFLLIFSHYPVFVQNCSAEHKVTMW